GTYDHREAKIFVMTNRGAPVSFEMETAIGGFFGGDRVSLTPALVFRFSQTFNAELGWSYNDVDLPGGAFETHLGLLRISYSFTPKLFVQGLFQYNDRADVWAANLRFGWLQAANTGLFVVYNESRELGTSAFGVEERSLIVKYSRLIDLLK
ncbi:MAG: hypothetical protein GY856_11560, partial [bacterium]|nr:hypothetical protein [bacterium]